MPLFAFEGREPQVSPGAWIAPTATLVGDVRVEAEASVWYGAVLRADFGPIVVRRGANIQDGSVLHRALVAAGATVPPGMVVPDGMIAVGIPARVAGEVTGRAREWVDTNPAIYRELARRYASGARPVGSDPWNIAH
jgi:carbonic anhydrase/acetyltransferase-like protein (isoleucine patch superfamily)